MDKQMIEKMGRMIRVALEYGDFSHLNIHDKDRFLTGRNYIATAEKLYNAGYRKIPENAVVLTREEYGSLVTRPSLNTAIDVFEVRKETAEKFAERVKLKVKELDLGGWIEVATGSMYKIVDEIAKEITGNDKMSLKRARIDAGGETRRK